MRVAAVAAALVGCSLVAPQSVDAQLARPKIDTVGSKVVRVMNPGPTAWADTNGWKLVLERTIQPKEGEPGELQRPSTVLRTSKGQFVVSDVGAPSISLYDASGRFIRLLGRAGAGPGEYRNPAIALDHDTLVIQDGRLGRVTRMTLDGKVTSSFLAKSNSGGMGIDLDGTGRVPVPVFDGKSRYWAFYSAAGKALDSLKLPEASPTQQWSFGTEGGYGSQSIPYGSYNLYRLLRDGLVLYGNTGSHQFLITRNGRDTVRIFGRSGVLGTLIPDSLRESAFKQATQNPALRAVAKASDIPKRHTVWSGLHEDGSGNFWIFSGSYWDSAHRFDVYTRDGRYLGAVPLAFSSAQVAVLGDRIGVIDTDADDLPRIRIYRIDRRGK